MKMKQFADVKPRVQIPQPDWYKKKAVLSQEQEVLFSISVSLVVFSLQLLQWRF